MELPGPTHQVDIWYVLSEEIVDPSLLDEYREILTPEELERQQKFAFEKSRRQHLITRVLVRTVLSHYTGHDARSWRFAHNAYGKPRIAAPDNVPLEFSLSHTDGLIVCAVTSGPDVGVDVESRYRRTNHQSLARRYFAEQEAAALEIADPDELPGMFFRFWTLKEAFIKAVGRGLSIPLADFAFELATNRPPVLTFREGGKTEPAGDWQFAQLLIDGRYQLALATQMPGDKPLVLRLRQSIPLRWQSDPCLLPVSPSNDWTI